MPPCKQAGCSGNQGQENDQSSTSAPEPCCVVSAGGPVTSKNYQGLPGCKDDSSAPTAEQKSTPIPPSAKTAQQQSAPVSDRVPGDVSGTPDPSAPVAQQRQQNRPPQNFFTKFKRTILKTWNDAHVFLGKMKGDRFRWNLFKSILFFTVGLKLFDDLARHLTWLETEVLGSLAKETKGKLC